MGTEAKVKQESRYLSMDGYITKYHKEIESFIKHLDPELCKVLEKKGRLPAHASPSLPARTMTMAQLQSQNAATQNYAQASGKFMEYMKDDSHHGHKIIESRRLIDEQGLSFREIDVAKIFPMFTAAVAMMGAGAGMVACASMFINPVYMTGWDLMLIAGIMCLAVGAALAFDMLHVNYGLAGRIQNQHDNILPAIDQSIKDLQGLQQKVDNEGMDGFDIRSAGYADFTKNLHDRIEKLQNKQKAVKGKLDGLSQSMHRRFFAGPQARQALEAWPKTDVVAAP